MLGVGEQPADVEATLRDLRSIGCDVVTFGQYLRPSKRHMPMKEYITPEAFEEWQRVAEVRDEMQGKARDEKLETKQYKYKERGGEKGEGVA